MYVSMSEGEENYCLFLFKMKTEQWWKAFLRSSFTYSFEETERSPFRKKNSISLSKKEHDVVFPLHATCTTIIALRVVEVVQSFLLALWGKANVGWRQLFILPFFPSTNSTELPPLLAIWYNCYCHSFPILLSLYNFFERDSSPPFVLSNF